MKKLLLLLTLCGSMIVTNAQTEKGSLMIGGDIGSASAQYSSGNVAHYGFQLDPTIGYFLAKNFVLGASLDMSLSTAKHQGTNIALGLYPLMRYYFSSKSKGQFFVEASVGASKVASIGESNPSNEYLYGYTLGPGYVYFITPNVGLEASLMVHETDWYVDGLRYTYVSPVFNVGFQIYFPKKKVSAQ